MKPAARLPDFAGVALVDILANGLAMLIIVIVLSIAARAEHEAHTSAQVEQVETMMSRRFSTSLVLNSLAASPPATLHDYDNSPLEHNDPYLLPILELHRNFVREFYRGTVWTRAELLREPNAMDDWLIGFDEARKWRLRVDVYDIAQFYLTMSILREHGIAVRHWHFLSGQLGLAEARRCPPGVAAKDCAGSALTGQSELPNLTANSATANERGGNNGNGDADGWPPPSSQPAAPGGRGESTGPFPGGAALDGIGELGGFGALPGSGVANPFADSFPNARPGLGNARGLLGGDPNGAPGGNPPTERGIRFRLSSPESLRAARQALDLGDAELTPPKILAALIHFISELQATLDAGRSPSAQLENFEQNLQRALASPPQLEGAARHLLDRLLLQLWASNDTPEQRNLTITPAARATENQPPSDTMLIVESNRRLRSVIVQQGRVDAPPLPAEARPLLRLNAHPDIWRGLSLPLERNAILLLPPTPQQPQRLRWRALAYLAPNFDDFIIGFAYAAIDPHGNLMLRGEDNRVRLGSRPLRTPYRDTRFGARGWLAALYAGLVLSLLGLLWAARRLATDSRA